MSDVIGELFEEPGKVRGHWRIPNFLSVPEEVDKAYQSPTFLFSDCCWSLKIYPNGRVIDESAGWIGLFLWKMNCGYPIALSYSFGLKDAEGEIEDLKSSERDFPPEPLGWGFPKFLEKSELQSRRKELLSSDYLTITFTVESNAQHPLEGSLFGRLWNVSKEMENILSEGKRTDVTLKLKDGEISAHRLILKSRSSVFDRMLSVDMLENETGEVNIEDATADAFRVALSYAYSGEPKGLNSKNATEVYRVAHKYEFEELRRLCTRFMQDTLSRDTVCDVIALAHMYEETTLRGRVKDYFAENKTEIFKSEIWKTFKRDNSVVAVEVLEYVFGGES